MLEFGPGVCYTLPDKMIGKSEPCCNFFERWQNIKKHTISLTDKVTHELTPGMIGLFFEDINYAADGGLYAEMIENRSFEAVDAYGTPGSFFNIPDPGYAWSKYGRADSGTLLEFVTGDPVASENPHYLRLSSAAAGDGFSNKAYDGIALKEGMKYRVSFYARAASPGAHAVTVSIIKDGTVCASGKAVLSEGTVHLPFVDLSEKTLSYLHDEDSMAQMLKKQNDSAEIPYKLEPADGWKKYHVELRAEEAVRGAQFVITADLPGIYEFDLISMIPEDAAAGVFRKDLFEALRAMKPGFIRFPGGCIIEGVSLENRYQWKRTVGPLEKRKIIPNLWAYDDNREKGPRSHRDTDSHYTQSYGIGFYEYFLLCEMLGAAPLPVLNIGAACQFRSHEKVAVTDPAFTEYIQDALDLVEFANGAADTVWGKLRAEMGHPEPFGLRMIGVGNEQWETKYFDFYKRAELFEKAIHEKYPDIRIIGSAGPAIDSPMWREAWEFYHKENEKREGAAYAVDEHYYVAPEWLLSHADLYDSYPREFGVFAGEYAAHVGDRANSMEAALAEAAFLTGVEKNGDVVKLVSYAPLFNRIGHSQWQPDMIWFDDQEVYLSPSYYVQKLFSVYAGDAALCMDGQEKTLRESGIYMNVTEKTGSDETARKIIVKLVNVSAEDQCISLKPEGFERSVSGASVIRLSGLGESRPEIPQACRVTEEETTDSEILLPAKNVAIVVFS